LCSEEEQNEKLAKGKLITINKMFYPEIGGVEVVAKKIAEIGLPLFDRSIVLTFNRENKIVEENIGGLEVIRINSILRKDPIRLSNNFSKYLKKFSDENNTFVFHFPSAQPELFFRFRNIKGHKICFYHSDIASNSLIGKIYKKFVVGKFLSKMNKIIVTSPNIIETSLFLKQYRNKIIVIPSFVDTEHFYFRHENKREYLLSFLKMNISDPKIIMYIGRFGRYKGLNYFVKSLSLLPSNYIGVLIGNGPKEEEIKSMVSSKNGLQKRVVFLDHVPYDDLPKYYSAADVFVLPSTDRGEAFGLVAIEAMACGIPVITTELGTGTSYHNIDNITGRVVPPKDDKALTNAILDITESPTKFDKTVIRKRAEEFSLKTFERRILNLFQDLTNKRLSNEELKNL